MAFFKSPLFYTNYFIEKFKISNLQEGIIEVHKKRLEIYFDSIPENKNLFYKIQGEDYMKRMYFKKVENGKYVSAIRYKQQQNSSLTIYSNTLPSLGFKIKLPSIE